MLSHLDGFNGRDFVSIRMPNVLNRWIELDLTVLDERLGFSSLTSHPINSASLYPLKVFQLLLLSESCAVSFNSRMPSPLPVSISSFKVILRGKGQFTYSLLPSPFEVPFKDKTVTKHRPPKRTILLEIPHRLEIRTFHCI